MEKKNHLHNDSKKINEHKNTEIELMKYCKEDILKYVKQHPETEKRGIDTYMRYGRCIKYESMDYLLKLLKEKKIDFEKYMIDRIEGRMDEEKEKSKAYFER